ncbi:hypothetical protein BDY17DRAFT_256946 [Neohortaea acidophila]|uniref:Biogenesis of lysosome-related organelles complex 1 subunit CNL1 n=1 Tax=Neohortaea acidophila TaxID=245834 RepID=A0A6A6PHZ2_9PEZI|nr:uncharacterized protein BDY17DRAFT_256946 [Neohortaea acidophila]KAF2479351.1 hypothetical protein BDY17DRAFT_256946 [Neohortaea acidophila]
MPSSHRPSTTTSNRHSTRPHQHRPQPSNSSPPTSSTPNHPPASPPASINIIQDTRLGLSPDDTATLRQHQHLAHAQVRSPVGSQASSQGRLLLDPGNYALLARHFDRVMGAIEGRIEQLHRATETATAAQYDRAHTVMQVADAEIARFRAILAQIDELELEFEKIARIREIVRVYRARVAAVEARLG